MQNKRLKKKRAKIKICKSHVWHGEKIKTKDVRVLAYRGKFYDYGLVERKRPAFKACPICGKTRRAGYYKCCASCLWVFEWQDNVQGLTAQASDMMKPRGASLDVYFYTPEVATIGLTISVFCDPEDSASYQREGNRTTAQFEVNLRPRDFMASTSISLHELRSAREPKKVMLDKILVLFEKSQKEMHDYIDRNGVMKTLGGCPVPVVGGRWGEPRFRG